MTTIRGTRRKLFLDETAATVCRVCGKRYKMLGRHVFKHGFTVESYKLEHGLPLSVGLVADETFEKFSLRGIKRMNNDAIKLKMALCNPPGSQRGKKRSRQIGALSENLPIRAKAYRDSLRAAATEKWSIRKPEFVRLWISGASLKSMAEVFGTKPCSIRNWVRNWNLPRRKMAFVLSVQS